MRSSGTTSGAIFRLRLEGQVVVGPLANYRVGRLIGLRPPAGNVSAYGVAAL